MKVMVMIRATQDSEAGVMPGEELLSAMGQYNEQLVRAGIMLSGEGLHPSARGARVRFSGASRTVINGPFAETRELIAGFWLWRVKSLEEAIEWVRKCPNPMLSDSEIEIRQVFDADDFGDALTPELREQEAALRAQTLGLLPPQFVDQPARLIAGLNRSYTLEQRGEIPQQWQQFMSQPSTPAGQSGRRTYGVCWNPRSGCGFDYLTGVEVQDASALPNEWTQVRLPGGRYAVFTHAGSVTALPATLDTIWTKWVPDCGLPLADTPSCECYGAAFDPESGTGVVEIWLPLA